MTSDKQRRVARLQERMLRVDREEIKSKMFSRLWWQVREEYDEISDRRFEQGKGLVPSLGEQWWGWNYTVGQCYEEAIRRAVSPEGLQKAMRPKFEGNDYRPYLEEEDFSEKGRQKLFDRLLEIIKAEAEDLGEVWNEVPPRERRRREEEAKKKAEADRRTREGEWKL
jgi:hypothetical protein